MKTPQQKLINEVKKRFLGTNLEKPESTHASTYFQKEYTHDTFKTVFTKMEQKVLELRPTARPTIQDIVPLPPTNMMVGLEGWLPQVSFGYTGAHAVRSIPDMVQVLEVCQSFINRGQYSSQEHPVFPVFTDTSPGEPIFGGNGGANECRPPMLVQMAPTWPILAASCCILALR